jgi:hypothetical protein
VSFLLCFACPNALATDRHLPRIVYLHEAMTGLRSALDPAAWRIDWAGHHARVTDLRHPHQPGRMAGTARAGQRHRPAPGRRDAGPQAGRMSTIPDPVAAHPVPVLAEPAPETLVFPAGRAQPGYPAGEIPRFGADLWQLAGLDHRHTAASVAIRWERFPLPLRAAFKRGCWLLINMPTPAVLHQRPRCGSNRRSAAHRRPHRRPAVRPGRP